VMDQVEVFTKKSVLKPGRYYIESDYGFPIRGNGWYYQPMIEYLLSAGILKRSDIKFVIYSSITIPKNYFNEFIDYLYNSMGDFSKLAVNSMIGCFKPKIRENWRSTSISTDKNEAFYHFVESHGCFVHSREINSQWFYQVFEKSLTCREETESPLYEMVLEMEAIELHQLGSVVQANKGVLLDLSTDCVSCCFPKNVLPFTLAEDGVNLNGFYYDEEETKPKYKLEQKEGRLKHERLPNHRRTLQYEFADLTWDISPDPGTNDFSTVTKHILDNKFSMHIDGRAGTGKSYLVKSLQCEMDIRGIKYTSLAPTNKACRIINGITIHKFVRTTNQATMKNLDYIFIDEISMVPEMFYKFFIILKRLNPKLKYIIAGDFAQLLPVKDRVECDYKNSAALNELCEGRRLQLTQCRRSDDILFNMLLPEKIGTLKRTDFNSNFTERHICFTNEKRRAINKEMMDKVYADKKSRNPKLQCLMIPALSYDPNSQDVVLVSGTPLIARKNNREYDICNNETFFIQQVQFKTGLIIVVDEVRDIPIPFDEFQNLFHPAYCITTHKSQGTTFNHPYTIHEWERLDDRLKYVALSRSTKLENINVTRPNNKHKNQDEDVDMFLDSD
jgi:hypothetical protein